ncbi:MAG: hypothetical protein ACYC5V_08380 [Gemmatimonadaceae bacterium]
MRPIRSSSTTSFLVPDAQDDQALRQREVESLRTEYRRLMGRINFRRRRAWIFLGLLVFTLAVVATMVVFLLAPDEWMTSQQSRFTQMTGLLILVGTATPLGAYFARRYDRQRERVRIARTREHEILKRLSQLDEAGTGGRRRRRRHRRSWGWRVTHPPVFTRPPLETMPPAELEDTADMLGNELTEARAMRLLAYLHAGIFGLVTLILAFVVTLSGPTFLSNFLHGGTWSGGGGPDPLIFWLTLTGVLVLLGGIGSHRVTVLLRRARAYQDRLATIERALWDVRLLLRERREEV